MKYNKLKLFNNYRFLIFKKYPELKIIIKFEDEIYKLLNGNLSIFNDKNITFSVELILKEYYSLDNIKKIVEEYCIYLPEDSKILIGNSNPIYDMNNILIFSKTKKSIKYNNEYIEHNLKITNYNKYSDNIKKILINMNYLKFNIDDVTYLYNKYDNVIRFTGNQHYILLFNKNNDIKFSKYYFKPIFNIFLKDISSNNIYDLLDDNLKLKYKLKHLSLFLKF